MAKKVEKEPEVDLVKDAVLALITTKAHVRAVDVQFMVLPSDAITNDVAADEAAIQDAVMDLLAEKKIIRKSYGDFAGYALPHV